MAIFKSSVFSEVRGSVGGSTYARNKAGQYVRNRSKPVNPNTANQSRVRSQFQTTAYGFSLLSVEQVAAWNQFAQGYPAVNKVGDTYTPSGRQMYMMCNQNLQSIGETPIDAPPYDVPIVPNVDISNAGAIAQIADPGPGPITNLGISNISSDLATAIIVVQTTPNLQPARQSYRNRMRQLGYDLQNTAFELSTAFNSYFGNPNANITQIINMRVAAVDPTTGVSSAWVYIQLPIITDA